MSLLQPEFGLLFWMLLSFVVVFVILAKFGFPIITQMVEDRKQFIDKSLEAAKTANEQLAGIKADGEAMLAEAREEQVKILNDAAAIRDKIINEAKVTAQLEAKKQLDEVRLQIQAEKEEAIRDVRRQIAVLSVDIAEKVIRTSLKKDKEQMDMIDRLLDEVTVSKS